MIVANVFLDLHPLALPAFLFTVIMASTDILLNILTKMKALQPASAFISSLYDSYCNRGGLSRKQLEGLLDKMTKTAAVPQASIATVEALILKKPVREKSKPTITSTAIVKDEALGMLMQDILEKYPQHKRILFLKSRYDKNEPLLPGEAADVKKLHKLLLK
jgi:hypothetical protein